MTPRVATFSQALETALLRGLSLGGGVQSCALALMSARGELPMLDFAVFADTGDEKRATYRYLDWLERQLPFPLIRTRRPGPTLGETAIANSSKPQEDTRSTPPFHLAPSGMASKQCNADFKREIVTKAIRALMRERGLRLRRGAPIIELWVGFSTDELERLAEHRKKFIKHRWPLLERTMNRSDCKAWFRDRQLPIPPKSSCVYCPYQGDDQWLDMRNNTADDDFQRAVAVDVGARAFHATSLQQAFVHRSCRPLAEVSFDRSQGDLFREDCTGNCGT